MDAKRSDFHPIGPEHKFVAYLCEKMRIFNFNKKNSNLIDGWFINFQYLKFYNNL
jgi:hypothetical protein